MFKQSPKKIALLIILIFLILSILIGVSYANWIITNTQGETNIANSSCFELTLVNETDSIHLEKAIPISDEEGLNLEGYTFTIQNICNTSAFYQVNLEEFISDSKKLDTKYIKVSLNENEASFLNSYEEVNPTIEGADNSRNLTSGILKGKESKTYNIKLWLDEDTPVLEEPKTFLGRISIVATYRENKEKKVTFDGNGGETATIIREYNEAIGNLPTNYKPGNNTEYYIFEGWYTELEGGEKVTADTVIKEDTTFYARYITKKITSSMQKADMDELYVPSTQVGIGLCKSNIKIKAERLGALSAIGANGLSASVADGFVFVHGNLTANNGTCTYISISPNKLPINLWSTGQASHNYVLSSVTQPECTVDGKAIYTCTHKFTWYNDGTAYSNTCNARYTQSLEASGHSYIIPINHDGHDYYKCSRCDSEMFVK